jgi:GNAT superfamily N-acetyltransferase
MVKVDFTSGDIFAENEKVGNMFLTHRRNGYVVMSEIRIQPEHRGKGYAQQAMEQLIDYANKNDYILALTPSSDFGSSKSRLTNWYKSLGFVMNKGRNKNFQTMELMYKLPEGMNEEWGGVINREIWSMNENTGKFNVLEFKNLNSFAARIRYAQQHLNRIASGSARIVYEIDPTKVLKLAKNPKGIAQNEVEISMGMHDYYAKQYVTEVFEADEENNTWLIAEKAKKLTPSRFYQITGVKIQEFAQWLNYTYFSNKGGRHKPPNVSKERDEVLWENEFASGILDLMINYNLPAGDLGRISSYGEVMRNGNPDVVLTDYGLTEDVFSTHYSNNRRIGEADTNKEDELDNFIVGREKWDGGYGGFALMPQSVDEAFVHEAKIETEIGWFDIDERLAPQQSDLFISHLEVFNKGQGNFKKLLNDIEEFAKEHGKKTIILEPDITQGKEYREFLENLYSRYGFKKFPEDPSLMIKPLYEGLADELITTKKMNTPIGKIFAFGGINEFEDYTQIAPDLLKAAVHYVEKFNNLRGNVGKHISDIYRNYLINVQNYDQAKEMAANDIEHFNNLIKIQNYLQKLGLVKESLKEDLVYWGATDAGPESDEYKIGAEGISEDATSLFMTNSGSDGELKGDDIDEDQTLIKTSDLSNVMDSMRGVFGIVSPHRITNNKENNRNSKILQDFLNKNGFSYTIGIGEWDDDINTHEQSFIIKNKEGLKSKDFLKILRRISEKFKQDAFIIGEDEKAFLIHNDGTVEEIGNSIEFTNNNYVGFDFVDEMEEGVGDKFLQNKGVMPDEEDEFDREYSQENEEVVGETGMYGVPIIKNPKSMKSVAKDGRAVMLIPSGDLYVEGGRAGALHNEILDLLYDKRIIRNVSDKWWIKLPTDVGFITLQRRGLDNGFRIGESNVEFAGNEQLFDRILNFGRKKHPHIKFEAKSIRNVFENISDGLVTEAGAGINRLMQHMKTNDFAIMSANRSELDSAGNKQANDKLSQELQSKNAGFVNLIGHWEEIQVGQEREPVNVREQSFFIPKPHALETEEFKEWIINLGKQFNQEAVLIGTPEEGASLYYMNGRVEKKGTPNLQNINKAYSQLRRKPDATFVFESRMSLSVDDYKKISPTKIGTELQDLMTQIFRKFNTKKYFSSEDYDDIIYLYNSMMYNWNKYEQIWGKGFTSRAYNLLSVLLKKIGLLKEDRIKTWMPKMTEPVIKKSCKLGGKKDGTSDACGQGDTGAVSYKKIKDGQSHKPNEPNVAEEEKWFDRIIKEEIITQMGKNSYSKDMSLNENILTLKELPFKDTIHGVGGQIYSVGGAVRDEFLGKESKDLDILITGIPMDRLEQILSRYGKVDPVGKSFGILKFVPKGSKEDIDVAIPRTEFATGEGGHKGFEVSSDHSLPIEKDLERRDFTINAMAKDINGNIIDPFGGQEDLRKKQIRLVNPQAFSDDPLRMLRAVQFASRFNFNIEPETMKAITQNRGRIGEIAAERILTEFEKIVTKGDALKGAMLLKSTGLMEQIFGQSNGLLMGNNICDNIQTMGEVIWMIRHNNVEDVRYCYKRKLKGDIPTYKFIKALDAGMQNVSDNSMKNRALVSMMHCISPD